MLPKSAAIAKKSSESQAFSKPGLADGAKHHRLIDGEEFMVPGSCLMAKRGVPGPNPGPVVGQFLSYEARAKDHESLIIDCNEARAEDHESLIID